MRRADRGAGADAAREPWAREQRGQHAGRAAAPNGAPVEKDIDVLWVSNLRALKRPELALELARQLPQVKFTLAGGPMPGGETYYEDVRAAAARLPNVTMPGRGALRR